MALNNHVTINAIASLTLFAVVSFLSLSCRIKVHIMIQSQQINRTVIHNFLSVNNKLIIHLNNE